MYVSPHPLSVCLCVCASLKTVLSAHCVDWAAAQLHRGVAIDAQAASNDGFIVSCRIRSLAHAHRQSTAC